MSLLSKKHNGIFRRKEKEYHNEHNEGEDDDVDASEFEDYQNEKHIKAKSRRPKETRFTQQRISSINPTFAPKSVICIFLVVSVIFIIFGAVMLNISNNVDEMIIYYQNCSRDAPTVNFEDIPDNQFFLTFNKNQTFGVKPQWKYIPNTDIFLEDEREKGTCQLRFTIPYDWKGDLLINYLIENFYANHKRYVLSFSEDQLTGINASLSQIRDTVGINCTPLVTNSEGKMYYPCGLIANSMFNDSFPMHLIGLNNNFTNHSLTNKNINWSSDKNRFKDTQYNASQISPPPNWYKAFPNGYNDTNIPNIGEWEEFQNWMRSPAFPKFSKLIRRSNGQYLSAGEYQFDIGLHWPVLEYNGKKAVYITHGSSLGGKNNFLGVIYLVGGCICGIISLIILAAYLVGSRKRADTSYLSWNKE